MSSNGKCSITVMFEEPFWICLYERTENNRYEVCKITFGAEPKDYEVYEFLLRNRSKLKFSPPVKTDAAQQRRISPKRAQREISRQLQPAGIGTKAQQALKLQYEQGKLEHREKSREQRDAEKRLRYEQRQQKKKEKRKGH